MAEKIVPTSVGKIFLLITLFGAALLQPIDCEFDKTELIAQLDESPINEIPDILVSVEDPDNVILSGFSVTQLLDLMDHKTKDCRPEELAKLELVDNTSSGLRLYWNYHFIRIYVECLRKFENFADPNLEKYMNEEDKKILLEFNEIMYVEPDPEEENWVVPTIRSRLSSYVTPGREETELAELEQLESSCRKVHGYLSFGFGMCGTGGYYLDHPNDQTVRWLDIKDYCKAYVNKFSPCAKTKCPKGKINGEEWPVDDQDSSDSESDYESDNESDYDSESDSEPDSGPDYGYSYDYYDYDDNDEDDEDFDYDYLAYGRLHGKIDGEVDSKLPLLDPPTSP